MAAKWQAIARRKKEEQLSRIPKEYLISRNQYSGQFNLLAVPRSHLTVRELEITESYDATALAEAIRIRKFTCLEVTKAFCKRAAIAHQVVLQSPRLKTPEI
jgi:amidase